MEDPVGARTPKRIRVYSDSDTGMMCTGTHPISLPVRKLEQHVVCAIIANIFTISKHHHNGHRLHHTDTDNRKNHSHDRTFLLSRNNPPWQQAAAKLHVEDPVRQTVPEWHYETYLAQWPFNIDATAFCRHAVSLQQQQQHWTPRIAGLFLRAGRQCSCCWCRILLGQESINHESTDVPSNC